MLKMIPYYFYFDGNKEKGLTESDPLILGEVNSQDLSEKSIKIISTNENNSDIKWDCKPDDNLKEEEEANFFDDKLWSISPNPNKYEYGFNNDYLKVRPLIENWDLLYDRVIDIRLNQSNSNKNLYARFIQKKPDFVLTSDIENNSIVIKSGESKNIKFISTLNGKNFPIEKPLSKDGIFTIDKIDEYNYILTGITTVRTTDSFEVVQSDGIHNGISITISVTIEPN